ncbi:MAG TPA: hypothetical protein VN688_22855 [Gemmataceae bacterium]|nr:hypothetical protein [Gemmataceae bacterium]
MSNPLSLQVAIHLPADLVAKMEELKQDCEQDRSKSIQQLVERFCRTYVHVLEGHRWEREHMEELEQSYRERPSDYDDAEEWEQLYKEEEKRRQP